MIQSYAQRKYVWSCVSVRYTHYILQFMSLVQYYVQGNIDLVANVCVNWDFKWNHNKSCCGKGCISDMNIQIASAAEEQSLVAEEINNNTVKIKDLSTQVSESAQQANEAMQVQTDNVRQQDELLNKFIV